MPHDRNGAEVKVGDRVLVEMVVTAVYSSVDFCNVSLKTAIPMPPYKDTDSGAHTTLTLNTKQLGLPG